MSNTRIITRAEAEAARAEANKVWDVYIALRATIKDAAEAVARKAELSGSYDAAVAARDKAREIESMVGQSILVPSAPAPAPAPAPAAIKAPPAPITPAKPAPTLPPSSGRATDVGGSVSVTGGSAGDEDSFEDDLVEPK